MRLPRPLEKLTIVHYPDPILRKKCETVEVFDAQLTAVANRMLALMREARGVGLAAPQVGIAARMFICNPTGEPIDDAVWVNPRLTLLEGSAEYDEGCLSMPGINVPKRRATRVVIEAVDLSGKPQQAGAQELLARIWQHEADHLDGRLVIDDMSEVDELANRRILRQLEADYKAATRNKSV